MSAAPPGYTLGVDLGTSNTVAVVRWPDGRTRPLLVDGVPVLPSGVYLDDQGRLHVGRDAQRLAQVEPARYEPNPKRRIDEGGVLLGDREIATIDMLAAVLAAVARTAMEAVGHLPPAVLTYPAGWGPRRRDTLAEAATRAGWPPPRLVPEPVGAARYFADVLRRPVPLGASIAVFDFGGGTLDVAVVRNDGAHYAVLGSGGITDLGGLDVDAALVDHLGRLIAQHRPDVWQGIAQPATTAQRRDRRLFWDDVRGAKEMLSRVTVAPVTVPGLDAAAHLTREELEAVAGPLLQRAVQETGRVIRDCGLRPDTLAGLFLVGGSSRLPLAARMLHAELGIAPTVLEQPELPVAEGALAELVPVGVQSAAAAPVTGPVTGPVTAPVTAPVSTGATLGTGPLGPASPAPYMTSGFPATQYGPPPIESFPPGPVDQRPTRSARHNERRQGATRRRLLIGGLAAVLVLALVAAGTYWFYLRDRPVEFAPLASTGLTVPLGTDNNVDPAGSYTDGEVTYVAWTFNGATDVAAIDPAGNKKLWQVRAPAEAKNWERIVAGPAGVVLYPVSISSSDPEHMVVLDPKSGASRWQRELKPDDRPYFYAAAIVVVSAKDSAVYALDWRTGRERWRLGDRPGTSGSTRPTTTFAVGDDEGPAGPATIDGGSARVIDTETPRLVQFDDEPTMRVIDVSTGKAREKAGVKIDTDAGVAAFGDRLYAVTGDSGYQVREFDLAKLGEPRVVITNTVDTRRAGLPARCGPDLVCFLEAERSDDKTIHVVAVNTKDGKLAWRKPAPNGGQLIPMGNGVLVIERDPAAALLFDSDGNQLLGDDDRKTYPGRVDGSSALLFSQGPSSSGNVAVTGVNVDGDRAPLGSVEGLWVAGCSWNREFLVCPTSADKAFRVWRFTTA